MTRALIVFFSQTGTTAQVADSIAAGLRAGGCQVDLCHLNDGPPDPSRYDLLGVGLPTYYYRPPFNVTDYVRGVPRLEGLAFLTFVLHGTYRGDAGNAVRSALVAKGAREVGFFACRGADRYLGYLKEGYLFSPGHPTPDELAAAEAFGGEVAGRLAGEPYSRPPTDQRPSMIYRLERFLANRWLASNVYSRLFAVSKDHCTSCGLCIQLCPTGNLREDEEGRPIWGRDCLLCLTCELRCPTDAITSPASRPLFRPFAIYNVRRASRDPSLDYALVTHRRGRTRPLHRDPQGTPRAGA